MRVIPVVVIAGAVAAVAGSTQLFTGGEEVGAPGARPPALVFDVGAGVSAFDDLSPRGGVFGTGYADSANVTVLDPLPRPPAAEAVLGAPPAGPTQLALVDAYLGAARGAPPACRLRPQLLAAIGQVESGSAGGQSLDGNRVSPGIFGPTLSGGEIGAVRDTDGGRLDRDSSWDRAVGPMQFLPGIWAKSGLDGDGDGTADPQNIYDAAVSAAGFLCYGNRDLSVPTELAAAILSYNRSGPYLLAVLEWISYFDTHGLMSTGSVAQVVETVSPAIAGPSPRGAGRPLRVKASDPKTVTPDVVRRAVKKAAEQPVAPPPPPPPFVPGIATPPPRPSTSPGTTTPPGSTTPPSSTSTPPIRTQEPTTTSTTSPTSTTTTEPTTTTTTEPTTTTTTEPTTTTTSEPPPPTTTSEPPPITTTVEPPPITTTVEPPPITTTSEPPPPTSTTTSSEPPPPTSTTTSSEPPPPTTTSEPPPPETTTTTSEPPPPETTTSITSTATDASVSITVTVTGP